MKKAIDLHAHTTASDGLLSPRRLIDYAIEHNIGALAITDHDTVSGIPEAVAYAAEKNYLCIPGIEFSIEYTGGSLHLLGLYIDHKNEKLVSTSNHLSAIRDTRSQRIIEDLAKHDIHIPIEEVEAESGGGTVGRPHIARVMLKHGYGKDIAEIFLNYLVKGKPGYIKKERISLEEGIKLIKEAGGVPIIAHPGTLNFSSAQDFEKQCTEYLAKGIEGLEVYSALHSAEEIDLFNSFCKKNNLLVSGGSDFHGDKNEKIGYYTENNLIPVDILTTLQAYVKNTSKTA